jgi:tRNA 2-thiouridine synthesizing protein A
MVAYDRQPRGQQVERSVTGTVDVPAAELVARADAAVDARGLRCPEPLMVVRRAVRDLAPGGLLHVSATDPSTARDIPSYCRFLEHELLRQWQQDGEFHFLLRKGAR